MFLQSAVQFAHSIWSSHIKPGSYIIDATCGNGQDTLFLAELALQGSKGKVFAFDVQEKALEAAEKLLTEHFQKKSMPSIRLIHACHSKIDEHCPPGADSIVFNLGYLPGGDKSITTTSQTTLTALEKSLLLLKSGGYLSITCYPGHIEGQAEASKVLNWAKSLGRDYVCCQHTWINRSEKSPFVILIHKN